MRQFARATGRAVREFSLASLGRTLRQLRLGDILILAGVVLVSLPLLWSIRSTLLQAHERLQWEQASERWLPPQQPFADYEMRRVWTPTRIICQQIGLDAVVVQGRDLNDLSRGPMHIAETAPAGEGNCVIAAHKEKWFRRLHELRRGDRVSLLSDGMRYDYQVIGSEQVTPYDISVLDDTETPRLTLITWLIVRARLVRSVHLQPKKP
jgi:LPXTG-site transpeptidase (sortase) family protein